MKKLSFLLCALILVLSLCSCQAREAETGQPAGKNTAEEAVSRGELLSTVDLMSGAEADAEATNKTYAGKYYLMNLVVDSLSDPEYIRAGFNLRTSLPVQTMYFTVDLPEEEREGLTYGDVLQVAGKIDKIEQRHNGTIFVEVSDARCVTKTFQVSGTVEAIEALYDNNLVIRDDSGHVFPNSVITVDSPGNGSYKEGDRITATGTLRGGEREGHICLDLDSWPFYMEHPESVEIVTSQE